MKTLFALLIIIASFGCNNQERPNEVVGGGYMIGFIHKKVEQAPVIVNDSGEITFDLWAYYHDRFLDFTDSTWEYMYNDTDKTGVYLDSMRYYLEKQKEYKK